MSQDFVSSNKTRKLKVKVYVPKAEGEEMSSGISGSSYACVGLLIEHQPGVISGFPVDKFDDGFMKDIIKTKKHALILSHQGPDGDSVGSSVSLSLYLNKIGIDNKIIFRTHIKFYSWVNGIENSIIASENLDSLNDLFDKSDLIFCLIPTIEIE